MLGRKTYTREEIDAAKATVDSQLRAYRKLAKTVDPKAKAALEEFEPLFFNNMTLALDRPFVHRVRMVTGKDANPLNEVELLTESLMAGEGVLRTNNVIKWVPDQTVLKLDAGDRIALTAEQFDELAKAFFAELERRFA